MPRVAPAQTRSRLDDRLARSTRGPRGRPGLLLFGRAVSPGARWVRTGLTSRTSLAQPRDEGACPGELLFVKRHAWRIATIAHCFDRLIDLAERNRRHGGVLPPLSKEHQGEAFVAKSPGPVERVPLGTVFLQRLAVGADGLFQLCCSALALPEPEERNAQVVLGHGPVARYALARCFLQRLAVGGDGLFQLCCSALALPEAA